MSPHHDQQVSDDENQTERGQMLSSTALLLNLVPLIDVTFSTQAISLVENCWSPAAEAPCCRSSLQPRLLHSPSRLPLPCCRRASYDLIDEGVSFKVPSEKWVCSLSSARNT